MCKECLFAWSLIRGHVWNLTQIGPSVEGSHTTTVGQGGINNFVANMYWIWQRYTAYLVHGDSRYKFKNVKKKLLCSRKCLLSRVWLLPPVMGASGVGGGERGRKGTGWHKIAVHGIVWCCMIMHGIIWSISHGTKRGVTQINVHGIVWYCMVQCNLSYGIACYHVVL